MRDCGKTKEQLIRELAKMRLHNQKLKACVAAARRDRAAVARGISVNDGPHSESGAHCQDSELQAIFHALPDLYFQLDSRGMILGLKAGQASYLYYSHQTLIGKRIQDVYPSAGRQFEQAIRQVLEAKTLPVIEYSMIRNTEEQFYEARLVPLRENQVIAVIRDITERKQAEEQLQFLSLHDPLTKLYNRAYFEQEMRRFESGRLFPVGIIVCDVDVLKLVNDTLGHNAGDTMLIDIANIIKNSLRQGEVVARIGGDEFAAILPISDRQALESVCNRIRNAVAGYNASSGLPLSVSIGYAICSDSGSMEDAFKEADINMYREKLHNSRAANSVVIMTLMNTLKARGIVSEDQTARIQELVSGLAEAAGLGKQGMTDLDLLVRFHDIGNIGVPTGIHDKRGRLSPEETAEMRRHCEIGHRITQSASELAVIAGWVLKHHEWFDGRGYPLGLKGSEIPLECRILAIAYSFDAMTHDRPYRKAMTPDEAVVELERGAGTQFDPDLVAEFLKQWPQPAQKTYQFF